MLRATAVSQIRRPFPGKSRDRICGCVSRLSSGSSSFRGPQQRRLLGSSSSSSSSSSPKDLASATSPAKQPQRARNPVQYTGVSLPTRNSRHLGRSGPAMKKKRQRDAPPIQRVDRKALQGGNISLMDQNRGKSPSRSPSNRDSREDYGRHRQDRRRPESPKRRPVAAARQTMSSFGVNETKKGRCKGLLNDEEKDIFGLKSSTKDESNKNDWDKSEHRNQSAAEATSSTTGPLDDVFGISKLPPSMLASSHSNHNDESVIVNKETDAFDAYLMLLDEHMQYKKFGRRHTNDPIPEEKIKKKVIPFLRSQETVVPYEYPLLQSTLYSSGASTDSSSSPKETRKLFVDQLKQQRERFMQATGFDDDQYQLIRVGLGYMIGQCAKHTITGPLRFLWDKFKQLGLGPNEAGNLHTLLHVGTTFTIENNRRERTRSLPTILDVLGGEPISRGLSLEAKEEEEVDQGLFEGNEQIDEIATYHDLLFKPTEQTLHSRVRLLVSQGNSQGAENLLREFGTGLRLHLRVFAPVLMLYLEQKDLRSALAIFQYMQEIDSVILDAETHIHLLAGIAENGGFNPDAPPIEGVAELGYAAASGPALFDALAEEMSENVVEIAPMLTRRLYNALATGMPQDSGLKPVGVLETLQLNNTPVAGGEVSIASLVNIDRRVGVCPRTGVKLKLKHLTVDQKETLKQGCFKLALERQKTKTNKRNAAEMLDDFLRWLDQREGKPFTAIVDGANVGFYLQNFDNGRFSYHQIEFVMQSLEERGEFPLVIIPQRYGFDKFSVTVNGIPKQQQLSKDEKLIRDRLLADGKMTIVRKGLLDDFYWILGSIADQSVSSNGEDLSVSGDEEGNRWPGIRPVLITNDLMRDHRLGMLEGQNLVFKRWFSNHIVNYNFSLSAVRKSGRKQIGFSPVDFYSSEIQGNSTNNGSTVWHFPLKDSNGEWLCVCLENKGMSQELQDPV